MRVDSVRKMNEVLGKEFETNGYGKCFVIDYKSAREVTVMFYNPMCAVKCQMGRLRRGEVKNPLTPSFYGKGYIGVGSYTKKDFRAFNLWGAILTRSYCSSYHKKQRTYEDVTVCDEWLNFQNFAEWCYSQEFYNTKDSKGNLYQLDKDLLAKDSKIYSPNTCCFIPTVLNNLIKPKPTSEGNYPIGVSLHRKTGKFVARVKVFGRYEHLGLFETDEQAFLTYKEKKETYIKIVAKEWKGKIEDRAYEALKSWQIN